MVEHKACMLARTRTVADHGNKTTIFQRSSGWLWLDRSARTFFSLTTQGPRVWPAMAKKKQCSFGWDVHQPVNPDFGRWNPIEFVICVLFHGTDIHIFAGEQPYSCRWKPPRFWENQHSNAALFPFFEARWTSVFFGEFPIFVGEMMLNSGSRRLSFRKRKTSARPNSSAWRHGGESHHGIIRYTMYV